MIYTNQTSKLSKKARAKREAVLKAQREIKESYEKGLKQMKSYKLEIPAHRSTKHIPSVDTGNGDAAAKVPPVYTGTSMIGIGQMHKSNAVPIFKQEDAESLANMRR